MKNQGSSSQFVNDSFYPTYLRFALLGALSLILPRIKTIANEVRFVEVHDRTLHIGLPEFPGEVMVFGLECFEDGIAREDYLYRGSATGQEINVDRISQTGRDRLFDRFILNSAPPCRPSTRRWAETRFATTQ